MSAAKFYFEMGKTPPWYTRANYNPNTLSIYKGLPIIEALPPINMKEEAAKKMAYYPKFDAKDRQLSAEERFHLIKAIEDLFVPLSNCRTLAQCISDTICNGYRTRHCLDNNFWFHLERDIQAMCDYLESGYVGPQRSSKGFTLIGISGIGKSTTFNRVFSMYPQVIRHENYKGCGCQLTQLVWLKLDCPKDGSIKDLCLYFFKEVDKLLGTDYFRNHGKNGRATEGQMIPSMARVAAIHHLGILVIDEIQRLSKAKSGGAERMLGYLVQLDNTIGVPVVKVGTYKALKVLTDEFRQSRRGTSSSSPIWDRMKADIEWDKLLQALWHYQYLRNPQPLTPELSQVLYDETQGIPHFAVNVFMAAQIRAIEVGLECITPDVIRSVSAEILALNREALDALRENDLVTLQKIGDINPFNLDPFIQQTLEDEKIKALKKKLEATKTEANRMKKRAEDAEKQARIANSRVTDANREIVEVHNDLRNLAAESTGEAYKAFKENGHIASADDLPD